MKFKHQAICLFAKLFALLMLVGGGNFAWAVNNALDFDGTGDYLTILDDNTLDITGNITIQTWIQPDSVTGTRMLVLKSNGGNAADMSYALRMIGDEVRMEFGGGTGTNFDGSNNVWAKCETTSLNLEVSSKYHIVGYRNDREIGIYVNNSLVCQKTTAIATSQTIQSISADVAIGHFPSFNQEFEGQMDEVAVWGRALSSDDISAIYNSEVDVSSTSNLVGYWKMDEGSSTTVADSSSNSNTATITNATWEASVFDATSPTLSTVTIASNNSNIAKAKVGDVITLTITASEALSANPVVTIAGNAAVETNTSGNNYTATYTMASGDSEGTVAFTIDFTDSAGNVGTQVTALTSGSGVTFDKTAPSITSVTAGWGASLNELEDNSNGTVTVVTSGAEDGQTVTLTLNSANYTSTVSSNSTSITVGASALQALSNNTAHTLTTNVSDAAGNTATEHTASSFTALNNPVANNALAFDGANDYVSVSNFPNYGGTFSQSAWVYPTDSSTAYHSIIGNNITDSNLSGSRAPFIYQRGQNIAYGFGSGSSNVQYVDLTTNNPLAINNWNHIATTFDTSGSYILYVNGVEVDRFESADGKTPPATSALTIGRINNYFIGKIDEVRIWSDVRTQSEIQAKMTTELVGSEANLVAYYKFNEPDTGTILSNSTTADYDGALTNMAGTEWTTSTAFSADTTAPTVTSFTSTTSDGSFKQGGTINITANTSESIVSGNTLTVTLDTGDTVLLTAANNGTALVGSYTVGSGDTSSDLTVSSFTIGTVADAAGNAMTSTTVPGTNIASGSAIVIDTTVPTNQNTVFASAATKAGGSAVTIVSSGDATNNVWFAPAGTTTFAAGATMTKATNGVSTSILAPATNGTYYLYVLDAAGNISSASTAALTVDAQGAIQSLTSITVAEGGTSLQYTIKLNQQPTSDVTLTLTNPDVGAVTLGSSSLTFTTSDWGTAQSVAITGTPDADDANESVTISHSLSGGGYTGVSVSNMVVTVTDDDDTTAPTNQNTVLSAAVNASGGGTVAIVSSGDTTNNVWFAPAGTTSFSAGTTMTKATNGVATSILAPATDGTYYLYVLDAAGNISTASTAALTVSSALPSPLNKADVTASIKAMNTISIDAVQMNFDAVEHRIAWLSSRMNSNKLSHQGIAFKFANPTVDKLMNTAYVKPGKLELSNEFIKLLRNNVSDGDAPELAAMTDDTKAGLTSVAFNEIAKIRENTIDKVLKATGGSILGDWNVWTEGRITVGKTYSTDTSAEQDSETQNISLGFDRVIKDDNQSSDNAGHIVGVVLGIGKSDANTTNNSTVDADSYSLSAYGVIRQNDKELAQLMMGYGQINVDKKRIDGADTLTGSHDAQQLFTSLMFKKEAMGVGSFSLSPYGKIYASRTWYDAYAETGGATALTYGEQTIDSTVLSAGVDADYMIPIQNGNIRPFMKFEYGADVSGSSTVNMHYNNEITNYQLALDNKADSNLKFVLGADMYTKDEWDGSISYERTEAVDAGYSDSIAVKVGLKF